VAQLDINWSRWAPWETLAAYGPRFVSRRFAIVCDRPLEIHQDEHNRPHRVDGPHIRWSDGTEIYSLHGVRVERDLVVGNPTAAEISAVANAEVRRVLIARYGVARYVADLGATVIHSDVDAAGLPRRLLSLPQRGDETIVIVEVMNHSLELDGSRKTYTFRCDPQLRPLAIPGVRSSIGSPQAMTCQNAIASTYGFYGNQWSCASET
jgi:hypothetical protein